MFWLLYQSKAVSSLQTARLERFEENKIYFFNISLCVQVQDGFIAHFYAVCEQISPVLAWGFLGPKSSLHDFCCFFKVSCNLMTSVSLKACQLQMACLQILTVTCICAMTSKEEEMIGSWTFKCCSLNWDSYSDLSPHLKALRLMIKLTIGKLRIYLCRTVAFYGQDLKSPCNRVSNIIHQIGKDWWKSPYPVCLAGLLLHCTLPYKNLLMDLPSVLALSLWTVQLFYWKKNMQLWKTPAKFSSWINQGLQTR